MKAWPDARINCIVIITARSYFFVDVYLVDCVYVDGGAGALLRTIHIINAGNADVPVQSEKSNTSIKCLARTLNMTYQLAIWAPYDGATAFWTGKKRRKKNAALIMFFEATLHCRALQSVRQQLNIISQASKRQANTKKWRLDWARLASRCDKFRASWLNEKLFDLIFGNLVRPLADETAASSLTQRPIACQRIEFN